MEHSEQISTFQAITGASKEEAEFYLESHSWDLEKATQTFISLKDEENQRNNQGDDEEDEEEQEDEEDYRPVTRAPPQQINKPQSSSKKPAGTGGRTGGIRTLSDFNNSDDHDHDHGDGDDEDDEKTQQYFTGGEKSGLMVESAPKKGKGKSGDIVNDVFDSAKRHGAVSATDKKAQEEKPDSFDSVGYQLGATDQGNRNVSKPKEKDPSTAAVEVKVTFWSQGFTIDDGPIRLYEAPENKELMQDIQRGVIPRELQKKATTPNGLSVTLINNHGQDYVEPEKPRYVAFSGGGQALGATSSTNNNNNNNNNRTTTTTTSTPTTAATVSIDSSQPTTTVQIRLANGTRLSTTFNQSHTLQDVINYINSSNGSTQQFDLLTGFPQKPISIATSTSLVDAGLLNALLIQKLK